MTSSLSWFNVGNGRITLGARPTPDYLIKLRGQGVTHIATIQTSEENKPELKSDVAEAGLHWLWLPFNIADILSSCVPCHIKIS